MLKDSIDREGLNSHMQRRWVNVLLGPHPTLGNQYEGK
jgi:hypothetical protein